MGINFAIDKEGDGGIGLNLTGPSSLLGQFDVARAAGGSAGFGSGEESGLAGRKDAFGSAGGNSPRASATVAVGLDFGRRRRAGRSKHRRRAGRGRCACRGFRASRCRRGTQSPVLSGWCRGERCGRLRSARRRLLQAGRCSRSCDGSLPTLRVHSVGLRRHRGRCRWSRRSTRRIVSWFRRVGRR